MFVIVFCEIMFQVAAKMVENKPKGPEAHAKGVESIVTFSFDLETLPNFMFWVVGFQVTLNEGNAKQT